MHIVLNYAFYASGILGIVLSLISLLTASLAFGAIAFTNSWFTNDMEYWTWTSGTNDTTGALTYKNNYGNAAFVVALLSPTDSTNYYAQHPSLGTFTGTGTTLTQAGGGAGATNGAILVVRRR